MAAALGRLKRRAEFLRAAGAGRKHATPGLVMQSVAGPNPAAIRYGLTASRAVGGAVERNRVRRRLRALAERMLAQNAATGHDYVLIGRVATAKRPFSLLQRDLETALRRLGLWRPQTDDARN